MSVIKCPVLNKHPFNLPLFNFLCNFSKLLKKARLTDYIRNVLLCLKNEDNGKFRKRMGPESALFTSSIQSKTSFPVLSQVQNLKYVF